MIKHIITILIFLLSLTALAQVNKMPSEWIFDLAKEHNLKPISYCDIPYLSENRDGFGNLNLQGFIDRVEKKYIIFLAKKDNTNEYYYVFATNEYLKTDKYLVEDVFKAEHFLGLQFLQGKMMGNFDLSEFISIQNRKKNGPKGVKIEASWIKPIIITYRPLTILVYINNEWFTHSLGDW